MKKNGGYTDTKRARCSIKPPRNIRGNAQRDGQTEKDTKTDTKSDSKLILCISLLLFFPNKESGLKM
jgi:hypothetical protein